MKLEMLLRSISAGALLAGAAGCTVGRDMAGGDEDAGVDGGFIQIDAGIDAGPPCEPDEMLCGRACAEIATDVYNCGGCDNVCPATVGCVGGSCSCVEPMIVCDGICLDPRADPNNCGGCGVSCGEGLMCTAGECIGTCDAPSQICFNPRSAGGGGGADAGVDGGVDAGPPADAGPSGGVVAVCADLQTDDANCGRCNTRCSGGASCVMGACTCPMGLRPCRGACVDVTTDLEHCGVCSNSCGAGGTCAAGVCTMCGTDRIMCSGRCLDVSSDPRNCGSCARACPPGESCMEGRCSCLPPAMDCGMGCRDLQTDVTNCGMCGVNCGAGGACIAGVCTCSVGFTMCGASCRNTLTDRDNCGMCGMACPAGNVCIMGACSDAPPTRYMMTTATAAEVPFIDACAVPGHTEHMPATDDDSELVSLGIPFRFWATDLPIGAMVNLDTNGWIGMNGVSSLYLSGTVPSTSMPNAVIAAHWGDNVTRGGICVATVGTAPNRQWVVEWPVMRYFGSADTVMNTFEIILNESSGIIDLAYGPMMGTRAQTMGIEDQTGMMGINACPGGTGGCIPTTGQRVRFLPIP
jgi:hypothetical protein